MAQAPIDLSATAAGTAPVIFGSDRDDASGYSVASAGDINGDGFDDLRTVLAICERHGGNRVIGDLAVERLAKGKKDEADLFRLAESHPEVRALLPEELRRQL